MEHYIANPIYDSVFKFLMEDERIARFMLSALLKKEVVDVKMRPNEYSNTNEKRISIFRIDFGATVKEEDGSEHLLLIELQKTWRQTEMTRFRQYLGVQYENKRNVSEDGMPLPIVSIYILGHKVGDITEPVVYVSRRYLDYDSKEITSGVPDPFVESLTHDSIIVQIPYLRGAARNHLEHVLRFFDQSFVMEDDPHILNISNCHIESGDTEMQRIVTRLASAASNPDIRHTMDIEDEIFSELESLDTTVLIQKKKIVEQGEQLAQQGEQLAQQGEQLAQQGEQISTLVKMMLSQNTPAEVIANALNISVADIQKYIE